MAVCLVIDDSEVIRLITRKILENLGHDVAEAESVDAAVDVFETQSPEVVFLDWDLPSLAALDLLKSFSELDNSPKPEIVLCATENDAEQFALARLAGASYHILKPYDLGTVRAVLAQIGIDQPEPVQAVAS